MNKPTSVLVFCLCFPFLTFGQSITDLVNLVSQDTLVKVIREFSGEDQTIVNGNPVTILNRESHANDIAADYLVQKFSALDNITINDQNYSANGRNIIATQLGKTNPNNIYIICAHYDSVDDYCADDNASGTTAVLEVARILSTQCFDNTIIYALWDEEEDNLLGSKFYADAAKANGDNILGVLNLDMMAYDGDGDNDFDIDVINLTSSIALKDQFLSVLSSSGLNLNANVVIPGSPASDHFWFWSNGFPAIFVGESWSNNDQTPNYHTANDRVADLDMDYFADITRLTLAFMATNGGLLAVDNSVNMTATTLTASQAGASYQWLDCNNDNTPIPSETNQSFIPSSNGNYAVQITSGSCVEISECVNFNTLSNKVLNKKTVKVYPNPVNSVLRVELPVGLTARMTLVNIEGKTLLRTNLDKTLNEVPFSNFSNGIYFVNLKAEEETISFKIVKE